MKFRKRYVPHDEEGYSVRVDSRGLINLFGVDGLDCLEEPVFGFVYNGNIQVYSYSRMDNLTSAREIHQIPADKVILLDYTKGNLNISPFLKSARIKPGKRVRVESLVKGILTISAK